MTNDTNETIDYEKYIRLASEDYREDSMNNRADIMRDAADSYAALAERVKKLEAVERAARDLVLCINADNRIYGIRVSPGTYSSLESLAAALDGAA